MAASRSGGPPPRKAGPAVKAPAKEMPVSKSAPAKKADAPSPMSKALSGGARYTTSRLRRAYSA